MNILALSSFFHNPFPSKQNFRDIWMKRVEHLKGTLFFPLFKPRTLMLVNFTSDNNWFCKRNSAKGKHEQERSYYFFFLESSCFHRSLKDYKIMHEIILLASPRLGSHKKLPEILSLGWRKKIVNLAYFWKKLPKMFRRPIFCLSSPENWLLSRHIAGRLRTI